MSDDGLSGPAIAVIELDSIAFGINCGDAMVKAAPVSAIYSGSIQPGKYVILVGGDTASVEVAVEAAFETSRPAIVDSIFLPDVHPDVVARLSQPASTTDLGGRALGIIETSSVATIIDCADAGVKAADVALAALVLGDGLGGRGYLLFTGIVGEVEAARDAAVTRGGDGLFRHEIISQLHEDMAQNLEAQLGFVPRMAQHDPGKKAGR